MDEEEIANAIGMLENIRVIYDKILKENAELKAQLQIASERIDVLSNKNIELSNQFEKMKCCGNCKHYEEPPSRLYTAFCVGCKQLDETKDNIILTRWELAE